MSSKMHQKKQRRTFLKKIYFFLQNIDTKIRIICYYIKRKFFIKEEFVEKKDSVGPLDKVLPNNMLKQLRLQRFSKIFFNMAIATSILVFIALLSSLITPLLYFFALVVLIIVVMGLIIFTAGAAFFMPGNPVGIVWGLLSGLVSSGESMSEFVKFCFNITKWISIVGIVLSVIAIVFLSITKSKQKFVVKIIVLSILILVLGVVFAFQMLTGGMQ